LINIDEGDKIAAIASIHEKEVENEESVEGEEGAEGSTNEAGEDGTPPEAAAEAPTNEE
jgi:hypothetical protein